MRIVLDLNSGDLRFSPRFSQVQIRPWSLADSDFVMDNSQPIDPRKTVFVGGVPRPLKAGEQGTRIASFNL